MPARDGLLGPWKYNPEARAVPYPLLPAEYEMDPRQWIIREVKRHINRIALIKYVRASLAQNDWDDYLRIYGLPGTIIIGPPNVAAESEADYVDKAAQVAEGSSAYLPNGSTIQFHNGPRIANPFREHIRHLTEQLILAGTGGILNMLAESGTGTLAGGVHARAFAQLASAEARPDQRITAKAIGRRNTGSQFPGKAKARLV